MVKYDEAAATNTSRPWLPGHRGWMAFAPGDDEHNFLRWRNRRGVGIPRKFKTPEAAMAAVDLLHPMRIKA